MLKKIIVIALIASITLTGCAGTADTEEPAPDTEPVAEQTTVATAQSETTEAEPSSTPIQKEEWTGKEAENPVDIEKFNKLVDRVWGNMQQHGVKPEEELHIFDWSKYSELAKKYKAGTLTSDSDEFDFDLCLDTYVLQLEQARKDYIASSDDKYSAFEETDITLPDYPSEVNEDNKLLDRWENSLIASYLTKGSTLVDSSVYNSVSSGRVSADEYSNSVTVNSNLSYTQASETISRKEFLKQLVNGTITESYSKYPNLKGWNIAPGTDSTALIESSTTLASEWGISGAGISKIFFAYDSLGNTSSESSTSASFRIPSADFAMLMKMFELLDNKVDDSSPELRAFLDKNSSEELYNYVYYLYSLSRSDENSTDFTPTLDEDKNTALYNRFKDDFSNFATEKAWNQLKEYFDLDKLSYEAFYTQLNNTSESTKATYGIAFADGTSASLTSGNVVNDFDWTMQFSIPGECTSRDSIAKLIKNYVVMIGTVTGENYSRCLDIASSGLVNKTISGNYTFAMDYFNGLAVATITKS